MAQETLRQEMDTDRHSDRQTERKTDVHRDYRIELVRVHGRMTDLLISVRVPFGPVAL